MPRVIRTPLGDWVDPAEVFATVCGPDTDVFWLDCGPDARSGRSYIGRASRVVTTGQVDSMLDFLRAELFAERATVAGDRPDAGNGPDGDGFALGWVGWLGYETRFETMGVDRSRESPYPDAAFLCVEEAIEFDHDLATITLLTLDSRPGQSSSMPRATSATPESPSIAAHRPVSRWRDTDERYFEMIHECKKRIALGEAYLLCLTTEVRVDTHPDPVETYLRLRRVNPSHHGALIRIGEFSLLSSSPEQFLTVSASGVIESRPIKGTRRRGDAPDDDDALAHELVTSEKERAENVMIVDLMRNDIGRVSAVGSVRVPTLLEVESYATVHQLVSTVSGTLDKTLSPIDAVVACFPAGSMTGAPKSSATRILDELEGAPRGIYSGAFGYFGLDGRIDLAMTIRTIVLSPHGASIGTGGGITALSDPDEELAEIKLKAAPLLRVLGVETD